MSAMFMQEKYGKVDKSKVTYKLVMTETQKQACSSQMKIGCLDMLLI
jgi:hypothetical protein